MEERKEELKKGLKSMHMSCLLYTSCMILLQMLLTITKFYRWYSVLEVKECFWAVR